MKQLETFFYYIIYVKKYFLYPAYYKNVCIFAIHYKISYYIIINIQDQKISHMLS